jgi:hypothetical protein
MSLSRRPAHRVSSDMIVSNGVTLLATICNSTPNAVPYALWLARGHEQFLVDLSDTLGQAGDCGLTGLACHGDRIYVAVQSSAPGRILILDRRLTPIGVIGSPEFADIHSIHIAAGALIVCSTGSQSVIRVDLGDHSTIRLCAFEASIHLNAACFDGEALLVCCHYPSRVVPEAVGGGVINAGRRRVVLAGLGQPHSLLPYKSGFLVLDSEGHRVVWFDHTGIRLQTELSGFLRGIAAAGGSVFVASSAGRVISRKNPAVPSARDFWNMEVAGVCIHELDAATLAVKAVHAPLVAGFEIYELLALEGVRAVDPPAERLLVPNVEAMARAYYESAKRALASVHELSLAASRP